MYPGSKPDKSAAHLRGMPAPLRRREFSTLAQFLGTASAHLVLRPITWLLRPPGIWPRGILKRYNRERFQKFPPYSPTDHDVVVGSYFKSGTNWTMQIAVQTAWHGTAEFEHIHDLVPWIEWPNERRPFAVPVDDSLWQNCPTELRIIKTHLPMGKVQYNESSKYVWVTRDPKDVFVSSYYFLRSVSLGPLMVSPEEWLDLYLSEDSFNGSWAEHLAGGWELRDRDNFLFLTYEEMKRDLAESIRCIAELMQVELSDEEFKQVRQQSSYEHMKANGHKFDTIGISPPWASSRGTMIRRGRSGESDVLLTEAQKRRIDDYWRAQLHRLGCDFPYDEHFAN